MRRNARSVMTKTVFLALPPILLLSGCAGVGNYLNATANPFGDPNAPQDYALNMQRARGGDVAVQPIRPQSGDVWPGAIQPVPTLSQIQQRMNVPLGQEYQNDYDKTTLSTPRSTFVVPDGARAERVGPVNHQRSGSVNAGTTRFGGYGHAMNGSSASPSSPQGSVPASSSSVNPTPTPAPSIGSNNKSFAVGQTVMGPSGPAGVVTDSGNGRYQTVAPMNGKGGGILIPNGNGTATLIQSNGQVITVQGAK